MASKYTLFFVHPEGNISLFDFLGECEECGCDTGRAVRAKAEITAEILVAKGLERLKAMPSDECGSDGPLCEECGAERGDEDWLYD